MANPNPRRKALFAAAVKLDGKTVEQWAAEQPNEKTGDVGISTAHLYEVLNDRSTSAPLLTRIDELIAKHFPGEVLAEDDVVEGADAEVA